MLNEFVLTVWGKKFSGFENFLGFEFAHKEQEDLLCITGSVLALEPVFSRPALQRFLCVCGGGVGEGGALEASQVQRLQLLPASADPLLDFFFFTDHCFHPRIQSHNLKQARPLAPLCFVDTVPGTLNTLSLTH